MQTRRAHEHAAATTPAAVPGTNPDQGRYDDLIAQVLATAGGHLAIGHGGFTLHFSRGAWLSGHDADAAKRACAAAGLPVIDSRCVPIEHVAELAISGPMVAVGHPPCPEPYYTLSYAPLTLIGERYRATGAPVSFADISPRDRCAMVLNQPAP